MIALPNSIICTSRSVGIVNHVCDILEDNTDIYKDLVDTQGHRLTKKVQKYDKDA